ncbi:hypothetical protein CO173_02620 [Candidatus Uhrbacteria bacterium CG_4_9_14_3_um_filter_41_35]|uniref:Ribosomal RNA small subunit methyltransferase H n=1 Tax=Candidatus Uhrbacteria bacterium CG_4_9_14_3_um_filter_41_35 TaxID=1975034 RepID=A0A2M7XFJ8_9BACT|nr:MAG: hypothetical protein CO173_02620 [Candidatus Uhrbacteria bacterium CG_4_9_14_3_um_filter_41_35]
MTKHIPVLAKEVLEGLNLQPGATVIDATLGLGGHAKMILEIIGPKGHLIGFDRDENNLDQARQNLKEFKDQITLIKDSFGNMSKYDLPPADAILFDLGFSSVHVDDASRGFSFLREGPLDMRYDKAQELTAEMIVNGWSKEELAQLFRVYGEEPKAREIAKAIFVARKKSRITSTVQLAEVVEDVIKHRGKAHPATRIFQAIRIAVNDEFGEIEKGFASAVSQLNNRGRLAIISFHSLEDKLIKNLIKDLAQLEKVTKKPIVPKYDEIKENKRARSAKLRIAEKI